MMRAVTRWSVAVAVLSSALVFAQTEAPPPPPPLPPEVPAAEPPPPPSAPTTPEEEPYKMGFRAGGSAGLGAFFPGPQFNLHLFDLHAGIQVSPMFGAYLRVGRTAGIGFSISAGANGGSVGVSASGFWLVGANAELSLGDSFFIAGGPQVGIGGWAGVVTSASTSGGGITAVATNGAQPGLDFKIGFALGGGGSRVKKMHSGKFTMALDLSLLYATQVVQADAQGNTSGASVSVNFNEALSIAPTIHLGYEFR